MKKYIFALALLILPIQSHAVIITSKTALIERAVEEKEFAYEELNAADKLWRQLVDPEKKEYMHALIEGLVETFFVKDLRAKLLIVGMNLIKAIKIDAYDSYVLMKGHLQMATFHFEMSAFYNELSLYYNDKDYFKADWGSQYFLEAINQMTLADIASEGIKDRWIKKYVSEYMTEHRARLLKELNNPQQKLSPDIHDSCMTFYENLSEILCELEQSDIYWDIHFHVFTMVECIEIAMHQWGMVVENPIRKNPDYEWIEGFVGQKRDRQYNESIHVRYGTID